MLKKLLQTELSEIMLEFYEIESLIKVLKAYCEYNDYEDIMNILKTIHISYNKLKNHIYKFEKFL